MRTEETGKNSNKCFVRSGVLQEQRFGMCLSMTSSMKAAIHLGRDFQENSEIYKNMKFENIENVFNITQKLIKEQSDGILNVKTLDYQSPSWTRSTLYNDKVIEWAKAKFCLHASSVLCLDNVEQDPGAAHANWT